MSTYYNENDPRAAAWLRELIARGLIAAGDVDERSIEDVQPDDIRGYRQCHYFAGIGGWSYALRLAGWPDDRPVWTGSCPCQPFSVAGRGAGTDDARHLWPAFGRLIGECQPPTVFGEQVSGKDGRGWLAGVRSDLEAAGYAVGAADLCAAGVGAPHIRQRLYWLADAEGQRYDGSGRAWYGRGGPANNRADGHLGDADGGGAQGRQLPRLEAGREQATAADMVRNPWSGGEWYIGSDGGARFFESGILPLAYGLPGGVVRGRDSSAPFDVNTTTEARVMRIHGYGNAIVPQVAAEFIGAYMDVKSAEVES